MGKLEPVDPARVEELRNKIALARDEVTHANAAVASAQERLRAAREFVSDQEEMLAAYVYPPSVKAGA